MRARAAILAATCAVALCASTHAAQRQVERSGQVAPNARIEIGNVAGTVTVTGWDRNEVSVQATLGEGVEGLSFENDVDDVEIDIEVPRRRRDRQRDVGQSHLVINVPRAASLEIETLAASISVQGVDGDVRFENTAGGITYRGAAARVEADSTSGDIEVVTSAADTSIEVEGVAGNVMVQFVAGDVRAGTLTGSVRVIGGRLREGNFESMSGSIYFEGELDATGAVSFENFNGDIELLVPEDSSAVFDITTYSGSIETEFGFQGQSVDGYTPEQQAEFELGQGGATVEIETFAGSVAVRRR